MFTDGLLEGVICRESQEENKINCLGNSFKDYLLRLLFCKTLLENHCPRYFLHLKNLTILNTNAYTAESVDEKQLEKFIGQFNGKLIFFQDW